VQNTCPDIAFAVHQCARFCNNPKCLHEKAVKDIAQYLWLTRANSLILKPNGNFHLGTYSDSDFASLWHKDHAHLCESVLSQTGYIITLAEAPIHWVSKLQTEIALSTTEAKYITLSTCARELLPLCAILTEILKYDLITNHDKNATLQDKVTLQSPTLKSACNSKLPRSIVYEDNAGCVILATEPDQN